MALRCPLWYALQFLRTLTQSQMLCEFVEQRMHRAFCFRAKYIRRLSVAVGHRAQRVPCGYSGCCIGSHSIADRLQSSTTSGGPSWAALGHCPASHCCTVC
jgi:hypothetical protein